jgi:hypothetical protein
MMLNEPTVGNALRGVLLFGTPRRAFPTVPNLATINDDMCETLHQECDYLALSSGKDTLSRIAAEGGYHEIHFLF